MADLVTEANPDIVNDVRNSRSLPDINDQHILGIFIESGITLGDVSQLRIMLGVTEDSLAPSSGQPNLQAFIIVKKWIELKAPSPEEFYEELEKNLTTLKLRKSIPRLYGRERYTIINPNDIKEFLAQQTEDFTIEQAYTFGLRLGFERGRIDSIVRDKMLSTGGSIILHIFESIDRNRTSIRAPLFDDILRALAAASSDKRAQSIPSPLVTSPVENLQPDKNRLLSASSSDQQPQDQRNKPQYPLVIEGEKSKIQKIKDWAIKNKRRIKHVTILVSIISVFILVLILAIAFLCLIVLPVFPDVSSQTILQNDTVLYTQESSIIYWLRSIKLSLLGAGSCTGQALLVDCQNIALKNESTITTNRSPVDRDYQYYIRNSTVTFTIDPNCTSRICSPLRIFLFVSEAEATENENTNFNRIACASPPENIYCIEIMPDIPAVLNVTENSYYFIRCEDDPSCSYIDTIEYNSTGYNYEATNALAIDTTTLQTGTVSTLTIHSRFDPVVHQDRNSFCVMMRLTGTCVGIYFVNISLFKWYDLVFYPSLFLGIILIMVGVIIGCYFYRKFKNKKLTVTNREETKQND